LQQARRLAPFISGAEQRTIFPTVSIRIASALRSPRLPFVKKTFPLTAPGKDDARVRDKIRHELNKYVRRERQKKLPEGFTFWTYDCKVGRDATTAAARPLKEVGSAIDDLAASGATDVYVEIVARPAVHTAGR
jgi:hypothetical protein